MPEEQAQRQQTLEKVEKAEEVETTEKAEKVDAMQEPQQPEKRAARPTKTTSEQALNSGANRSYWPFALAIVLSIGLMGVVIYPIIFFIGMALTVIIIIAWSVDRR